MDLLVPADEPEFRACIWIVGCVLRPPISTYCGQSPGHGPQKAVVTPGDRSRTVGLCTYEDRAQILSKIHIQKFRSDIEGIERSSTVNHGLSCSLCVSTQINTAQRRVYSTSITTHKPIVRLHFVCSSIISPTQTIKQRHCFATCSCRDDLIMNVCYCVSILLGCTCLGGYQQLMLALSGWTTIRSLRCLHLPS